MFLGHNLSFLIGVCLISGLVKQGQACALTDLLFTSTGLHKEAVVPEAPHSS